MSGMLLAACTHPERPARPQTPGGRPERGKGSAPMCAKTGSSGSGCSGAPAGLWRGGTKRGRWQRLRPKGQFSCSGLSHPILNQPQKGSCPGSSPLPTSLPFLEVLELLRTGKTTVRIFRVRAHHTIILSPWLRHSAHGAGKHLFPKHQPPHRAASLVSPLGDQLLPVCLGLSWTLALRVFCSGNSLVLGKPGWFAKTVSVLKL